MASLTLKHGSRGTDVERLQSLLVENGFPLDSIDGFFGSLTEAAVLDFQKRSGLPADGIADAATLQVLSDAAANVVAAKEKPGVGEVEQDDAHQKHILRRYRLEESLNSLLWSAVDYARVDETEVYSETLYFSLMEATFATDPGSESKTLDFLRSADGKVLDIESVIQGQISTFTRNKPDRTAADIISFAGETDLPKFSPNAEGIIEKAAQLADGAETVGVRHFLGGMMLSEDVSQKAYARRHLEGVFADLQQFKFEFYNFHRENWPAEDSMYWDRLTVSWLAVVNNDRPDGTDLLDFENDVNAFAKVITHGENVTPLSIGLFGDWGSGKSFFMEKLRDKVDYLDSDDEIVQIWFNAWHYAEGELWASLVTHIFECLANGGLLDAEKLDEEQRELRRQLLQELTITRQELSKLEEKKKELQGQKKEAAEKVDNLLRSRVEAEANLSRISLRDVFSEVTLSTDEREKLDSVLDELNLSEKIQTGAEALQAISDLSASSSRMRLMFQKALAPGFSIRLAVQMFVILAALIVVPVISTFAMEELEFLPDIFAKVTEGLAIALAGIYWLNDKAVFVRNQLSKFVKIREGICERAEALRKTKDTERLEQETQLSDLVREIENAKLDYEGKSRESLALEKKLDSLEPSQLLNSFIHNRAESDDYKKHLGLISLVRRDFERLTVLMDRQQNAGQGAQADLPMIRRIVLYIDDLDRCPPDQVVRVLEAINLLLSTSLFVVVVGVDARWVYQSLKRKYPALLGDDVQGRLAKGADNGDLNNDLARPGATMPSLDSAKIPVVHYLEKIFQVPFWLRPMGEKGYTNLIDNLAGELSERTGPVFGTKQDRASFTVDPGDLADNGGRARPPDDGAQDQVAYNADTVPESNGIDQDSPDPSRSRQANSGGARVPDFEQPELLVLSEQERTYMKALGVLVGRSPRGVKRFVNVYSLLRAKISPTELPSFLNGGTNLEPAYQWVLFFLAISMSDALAAREIAEGIVAGVKKEDIFDRWDGWMKRNVDHSAVAFLQTFRHDDHYPNFWAWTPNVARYSFHYHSISQNWPHHFT